MISWLDVDSPFPDVSKALTEPAGLLAAGADLSPQRLLNAYRHGIFPWFSEGQPILWWSTDPRMVLYTDRFIISDSLKKTLRKIERSRHTDAGTWISKDIVDGYCGLHRAGYAHSSEVWLDGKLVGGAYGVSIGQMFYGESMFARVTDASKVALAYLVHFLRQHGVQMIDCQQETPHLASLGAAPIPRQEFLKHLRQAIEAPQITFWHPLDLLTKP